MDMKCPVCQGILEYKPKSGKYYCDECQEMYSAEQLAETQDRPEPSRTRSPEKEDENWALHELTAFLPSPLAVVIQEYAAAAHGGENSSHYEALHRMCDAVEIMLRFFSSLLFSEILKNGEFSPGVRNLLVDSIERPTMGSWVSLLEQACAQLKGLPMMFPPVLEFTDQVLLKETAANGSGGSDEEDDETEGAEKYFLPLRNYLAHSGRLSDSSARRLHEIHRPRFIKLCQALEFFKDGRLLGVCSDGIYDLTGQGPVYDRMDAPSLADTIEKKGRLVFSSRVSGSCLDIFPIVSYSEIFSIKSLDKEGGLTKTFQIYTRANRDSLEYTILADPEGTALISRTAADPFQRFREIFRLEEWRKIRRDQQSVHTLASEFSFEELIKQLAGNFKGRTQQLNRIKQWYKENHTGVLWVEGRPGTGKSALMAKLVTNLKGSAWGLFSGKDLDTDKLQYVLIPYFFRRSDPLCREIKFLEASIRTIQAWLQKNHPETLPAPPGLKKDIDEYRDSFREHLKAFSNAVENLVQGRKKLIIIMDGINELAGDEPEILHHPFENRLPGVLWICSSWSVPKEIDPGRYEKAFGEVGLPPLTNQEIYAFLANFTDVIKYELIKRDGPDGYNPFIETVKARSEGLPIYLSYLVEDLRSGKMSFKDEGSLPNGLEEYYRRIFGRNQDVSDIAKVIVLLLALAKEPLNISTIKFALRTNHLVKYAKDDIVERALKSFEMVLIDALIPGFDNQYGKTIYHESCRDYCLNDEGTRDSKSAVISSYFPSLISYLSFVEDETTDPTFYYTVRNLPAHLIEAVVLAHDRQWVEEVSEHLNTLTSLITSDEFVYRKAVQIGLMNELIEDFSHSLEEVLSLIPDSRKKDDIKKIVIRLLQYDFPSVGDTDRQGLLQEMWFEYASDILADFCHDQVQVGQELLDDLFKKRDHGLALVRLSLQAAELSGDYQFLVRALEYESAEGNSGGTNEVFDSGEDDLTGVSRWVVDALFLVARRDISAGRWERFEGLIDSLISSLEKVLLAGHNQWLAALNAALQRKKITVHLKSVFEVVYKIFINYPQDRKVAAYLSKMGSSLGGIIYDMPVKTLVRIPGLVSLIYSIISLKWNSVTENGKRHKSIEEIFTVTNPRQIKVIQDFNNLILLAEYEGRDAATVFPALVDLAFCSGLVSTSDEMYQVNRAIHGHVLYHMCKFFPREFRDLYVNRYFLQPGIDGAEGLAANFREPISRFYPEKSLAENLEGSRGLYEMLVRFLTYEAVSTDAPAELLVLNESLIRYIIDHDTELFCQDYNIVGRALHILTAVTIAEARIDPQDGQPGAAPTLEIIRDLAEGRIAANASEAERWEAVSKCYFDLFYAGIFQVEHVLRCFESLVDLKKAAQSQAPQLDFQPTRQEVADLFMISDLEKVDQPTFEAMQKAAGRYALVMLALKTVDRPRVQTYLKRGDIPDSVWQKLKKWSVFMEKRYPAPSKKVIGVEQMVEKYYEQLAIGLFTNVILVENREVRELMANVLKNLLEVNRKKSKKGGPRKDDLLGLLRGIMEEVFEILKKAKRVESNK